MTTWFMGYLAVLVIDVVLAACLWTRGRRHTAEKYMAEACVDAAILALHCISGTGPGALYGVSRAILDALVPASILFRIHILYEHIAGDIRIMKEKRQQSKDPAPAGDIAKRQRRRSLSVEDREWIQAMRCLAAGRRHPAVTLVLILSILLMAAFTAQLQFFVLRDFSADGLSARVTSALALFPLAAAVSAYKELKKKINEAASLVLSVLIDLFVFIAWTTIIIDVLSPDARISIFICDLVLYASAGKLLMRSAKAARARLSVMALKRSRSRLKEDIDGALAEGGTVVFPDGSRQAGAVIMPDGKVRKLCLDRYADILLKDVARILPGESAEDALRPVPEAVLACGKGKNVRQWAAEVRRDAKKKCAKLRDVSAIIDIKDRSVVGITGTGEIVCVRFPERVYCIFDRPEELIGAGGCAWRMLQKKLLPASALARVKNYYMQEG